MTARAEILDVARKLADRSPDGSFTLMDVIVELRRVGTRPLFLVAPDDRRDQVVQQVNRPTFARMDPPLVDVCRYISFEQLRDELEAAKDYVSHLKASWLQTISEPCISDEDL